MYHVLLDMCPDDCMGARIKDVPFNSLEDAKVFFNRPYSSIAMARADLLYLFPVDEADCEWFLHATCGVTLIDCDVDIFKLPQFYSENDCNAWMNNWDGIGLIEKRTKRGIELVSNVNNLQDIYEKYGATALASYWIEFDVREGCIEVKHHDNDEDVILFEGEVASDGCDS